MFPALLARALGGETVAVHGDVKSFFLAGDSRGWFGVDEGSLATLGLGEAEALEQLGLASPPFAQGVMSGRLKASTELGVVRAEAHWALAAQTTNTSTAVAGLGTGVGLTAPELVPLTWSPDTGDGLSFRHRLDRLVVSAKLPPVDLALGRQPVSFGVGRIFTPLDLVNPFHPATIDAEYKPGVDALRVDVYSGVATRLTVVGAWAGDPVVGKDRRDTDAPVLDELVLAASGQGTLGVTDVLVFAGVVRAEPVFGLGSASSLGPVGVHAEGTLTLPGDGEDPFVRAVAGADGRPTGTTTVLGEVYLQSLGATDPANYLAAASGPRFQRGELWQMGQLYGSVSLAQELTPLVHGSFSVISNLRDPSALLALGGSWSVADNADVGFGAWYGLGRAPETVDVSVIVDPTTQALLVALPDDDALAASVRSEFGLYPLVGYVQVRAYF